LIRLSSTSAQGLGWPSQDCRFSGLCRGAGPDLGPVPEGPHCAQDARHRPRGAVRHPAGDRFRHGPADGRHSEHRARVVAHGLLSGRSAVELPDWRGSRERGHVGPHNAINRSSLDFHFRKNGFLLSLTQVDRGRLLGIRLLSVLYSAKPSRTVQMGFSRTTTAPTFDR